MTTIESHSDPRLGLDASSSGLAHVAGWVTSTDHKRIGRMYLGAAALFFVASATVALLLGIERISPDREWLDIGSLTQLFALERFGFVYLVLVPLSIGIAIAIVPLQVGARSLVFPRLAAAGFWAWLIGAGLAVYALVNNGGPNGGNGRFVDLFTLSAAFVVAGLLAGVVSLLTTILTNRAPGMNMRRVPFFTWSVLVSSLCLVVALPVLIGDLLYVYVAHHYPSISELSGNRALSQWAGFGFTQPTTILFAIPVLGFLVDVVATATGRRLQPRGGLFACIALVGIGVFATVLQWPVTLRPGFSGLSGSEKVKDLLPFLLVHGLPVLGAFTVVALSLKNLVGKPKISAHLVFALGAGVLLLGAVVANLVAHVGAAEVSGTVFEEGTMLTVVYAGVLLALGAVTYWGPKWWGRALPMKSTLPLALLAFVGAMLATDPLLIAGFADQPGGVFPSVERGNDAAVNFLYGGPYELWNLLSAVGHGLVLLAVLAFIALALKAFLTGEAAGDDPWDGHTLEWATTSPAPADNFAAVHIVRSAEPLLDLKPSNRSDA
ncbi:MAG: cbb3-type cytochrome c oxidase subunit I [Ilumatobacteraceae bacterium]